MVVCNPEHPFSQCGFPPSGLWRTHFCSKYCMFFNNPKRLRQEASMESRRYTSQNTPYTNVKVGQKTLSTESADCVLVESWFSEMCKDNKENELLEVSQRTHLQFRRMLYQSWCGDVRHGNLLREAWPLLYLIGKTDFIFLCGDGLQWVWGVLVCGVYAMYIQVLIASKKIEK